MFVPRIPERFAFTPIDWRPLLLVACLSTSSAWAAPQSVPFAGWVESIPNPTLELGPAIRVGSPLVGHFTIDPDSLTGGIEVGLGTGYFASPAAGPDPDIALTIEGRTFASPLAGVVVANDRPVVSGLGLQDRWTLTQILDDGSLYVTLHLFDPTTTRLADESLFVETDLAGWSVGQVRISRYEAASGVVDVLRGALTRIGDPQQPRFVNVDVGAAQGVPASRYGAAGRAGLWNAIGLGETITLDDASGVRTPVRTTLATASANGSTSGTAGPALSLLGDHAFDCVDPDEWSLRIEGLDDGFHRVLLYAPANPNVATGQLRVNGVPMASRPGDAALALIEDVSWDQIIVGVTGGTLELSGVGSGASSCAGIAGVQVEGPVPEPSIGLGLLIGTIALPLGRSVRGRRQASSSPSSSPRSRQLRSRAKKACAPPPKLPPNQPGPSSGRPSLL